MDGKNAEQKQEHKLASTIKYSRVDLISTIQTPLGFFVLAVLIVEAILGVLAIFSNENLKFIIIIIISGIILLLVFLVSGMAIYRPSSLYGKDSQQLIKSKNNHSDEKPLQSGYRNIFDKSENPEFQRCVTSLIQNATRAVMIGIGLNIMHRDTLARSILETAAQKRFPLEIYLADPESPSIELRLIEEEILDSYKPPVGRSGLRKRINVLIHYWKEILRHPENISIKLFTHYPTFALIIIDKEYFIYPYGYATVGNFSPVLHFSENNKSDHEIVSYLIEQYQLIKESAVDADYLREVSTREVAKVEGLHPLALYFVPPEDSVLYQYGSDILGWDVRNEQQRKTSWQEYLGGASQYGFHLTVCDCLYFANLSGINLARESARFLCKDFLPFELSGLKVVSQFPNAQSISIVAEDNSGTLEALHHDLVSLVYRRAVASNYTLGKAELNRDKAFHRARLMINRYKAPYILDRYKPHFTLLANIPAEKQEKICDELNKGLPTRHVHFDRLAVMGKLESNKYWHISEELKLG